MRDIKFRGQSTNTGKWVYGFLCYDWDSKGDLKLMIQHSLTNIKTSFSRTVIDEETVGQYTGLQDNKGKDIYEGDILKGVWHGKSIDKDIYGVVDFKEGMFGLENELENGEPYTINRLFVEVIGNTYENTEH